MLGLGVAELFVLLVIGVVIYGAKKTGKSIVPKKLGSIIPKKVGSIATPGSGLPKRYSMLRHAKFVQFKTLDFTAGMTPHDFHWRVEEALEDQGVASISGSGPSVSSYWTPLVPGENGTDTNVADYMSFEGGLTGKRGEPIPLWIKLGIVISFLIAQVLPTITFEPLVIVFWWIVTGVFAGLAVYWRMYKKGTVAMRYRGTYTRQNTGQGHHGKFSVDLMFSVNVKKPLFGEAIGMTVIEPIYNYIETSLCADLETSRPLRFLPEMVSRNKNDYEDRFPVEIQQ